MTAEVATRAQGCAKLISVFGVAVGLARAAELRFSLTAASEEPLSARLSFRQHEAMVEDDEAGELVSATPHGSLEVYRPLQKVTALGDRGMLIAGTAAGQLHVYNSVGTLRKQFCRAKPRCFRSWWAKQG